MRKLKKCNAKKLEAKLRNKAQFEVRQWIDSEGVPVTERSPLYRKEPVKTTKGGFIIESMVTNMMVDSDEVSTE